MEGWKKVHAGRFYAAIEKSVRDQVSAEYEERIAYLQRQIMDLERLVEQLRSMISEKESHLH
ncbi:MAG: hypothetical protein JXR96_09595 [Deltaproteobacteria bacterium]|nr:hypothetical protein [Deltaproteobacteria bacterium]